MSSNLYYLNYKFVVPQYVDYNKDFVLYAENTKTNTKFICTNKNKDNKLLNLLRNCLSRKQNYQFNITVNNEFIKLELEANFDNISIVRDTLIYNKIEDDTHEFGLICNNKQFKALEEYMRNMDATYCNMVKLFKDLEKRVDTLTHTVNLIKEKIDL